MYLNLGLKRKLIAEVSNLDRFEKKTNGWAIKNNEN